MLIEEGRGVEYGKEFIVKKLTNPMTVVNNGITHIQVESRDVIAKELDCSIRTFTCNVTPTYVTADPENSKYEETAERMSE